MFLLAVSSFWFGCNNAAKEIVKERTIYTRERDFNLRVGSYYASKVLLLTVFSWLQTVLLFAIVRPGAVRPVPFASELIVLLALALAGVTLGLAISAFAATEEMAITLIPMAVIPQIILSGAISPLEGMSKVLALVGVSTYWGKRGLDACLPEEVWRNSEDDTGSGTAFDRRRPAGVAGARRRVRRGRAGDAVLAKPTPWRTRRPARPSGSIDEPSCPSPICRFEAAGAVSAAHPVKT